MTEVTLLTRFFCGIPDKLEQSSVSQQQVANQGQDHKRVWRWCLESETGETFSERGHESFREVAASTKETVNKRWTTGSEQTYLRGSEEDVSEVEQARLVLGPENTGGEKRVQVTVNVGELSGK